MPKKHQKNLNLETGCSINGDYNNLHLYLRILMCLYYIVHGVVMFQYQFFDSDMILSGY